MHILWIILIRFVAGVIAKLITSGVNEAQILATPRLRLGSQQTSHGFG